MTFVQTLATEGLQWDKWPLQITKDLRMMQFQKPHRKTLLCPHHVSFQAWIP